MSQNCRLMTLLINLRSLQDDSSVTAVAEATATAVASCFVKHELEGCPPPPPSHSPPSPYAHKYPEHPFKHPDASKFPSHPFKTVRSKVF